MTEIIKEGGRRGQFWFPEEKDVKKFNCESLSVHFQDCKYNN